MRSPRRLVFLATFALALMSSLIDPEGVSAQDRKDANTDEAKVGAYTLPDALTCNDGTKVTSAELWKTKRRPEILEFFKANVFGRLPANLPTVSFEPGATDPKALNGIATRKEIVMNLTGRQDGLKARLLIYIPNAATKPVPAFLSLNFTGNHAINADPGITISTAWVAGDESKGVIDNRATEAARGTAASRFPLELILSRGYALATIYYGAIEPDHSDGWKDGIRAALSPDGAQTQWKDDDWGAIAAWSWGLSKALDYMETDTTIDAKRVAVIGHSRQGKTSLWAGVSDERFAMVISNCSGEGGAALARRNFGETTAIITKGFPNWFCPRYKSFANAADKLPIDAHELIALAAPRPVYVASATADLWADPKGEFLSAKNAEPVYALFGKSGLCVDEQPAPDKSVGGSIGYHIRTGKHDITAFDWEQYLNFADRNMK